MQVKDSHLDDTENGYSGTNPVDEEELAGAARFGKGCWCDGWEFERNPSWSMDVQASLETDWRVFRF